VTLWDCALAVQLIRAEVGEISTADKPVGGSIVFGPVVSLHDTPVAIAMRANWTVRAALSIEISANVGACLLLSVTGNALHLEVGAGRIEECRPTKKRRRRSHSTGKDRLQARGSIGCPRCNRIISSLCIHPKCATAAIAKRNAVCIRADVPLNDFRSSPEMGGPAYLRAGIPTVQLESEDDAIRNPLDEAVSNYVG